MSAFSSALKQVARQTGKAVEDVVEELERAPGGLARIIRQPGAALFGRDPLGRVRMPFFPRTPREPIAPTDTPAPAPGDYPILSRGGQSVCGKLDAWGAGQPFALIGFVPVAAGAQTQGTSIASFHLATSNPTIITTDNLIPGNIEVFTAHLSISARLTTTLGFEGNGFLESAWVIETVNGIEKARWSLRQLATITGVVGIITSGGAATGQRLDLPSIPWHRKYDPNVPHIVALQIARTTTTVSILDCSFVENGIRP